jgi:hypothetical protein
MRKRFSTVTSEKGLDMLLQAYGDDLRMPTEEEAEREIEEAIASGVITREELDEGLERFLDREVILDPTTGRVELVREPPQTIGQWVRAYRRRKGFDLAAAARELGASANAFAALEAVDLPFDDQNVAATATKVAAVVPGITARNLRGFLARVRVTIDESDANAAPVLEAARIYVGGSPPTGANDVNSDPKKPVP